jgi:CBS domain containing-hemolysin-like protein
MLLLVLLLAGTLGFSFLCSILEAVILSVTPSFVVAITKLRPRTGHLLAGFKRDAERPLAAILSLNTIANTAGATGVGAQALALFGSTSVGVVSALLTLLVLFLSEIIPKTIGATYWRALAPPATRVTQWLIYGMFPFVWAGGMLRRVVRRGQRPARISAEELHAIADLGRQEGVVQDSESRVLRNVIRFGSLRVREIMTPRTVVVAFPEQTTVQEVLGDRLELRFSRVPIYADNIDAVTGYVLKSDLLLSAAQGRTDRQLAELKRNISLVPDTQPLRDLFTRFLDQREHIAVLVDQYGGMAGIVTMEDVVESLLGSEIVDESDVEIDMQKLARRRWERRAREMGMTDVVAPEPVEPPRETGDT